MNSFFVLSGETTTLAAAELKALLDIYLPGVSLEWPHPRLALVEGRPDLPTVVQRAAYTTVGGPVIGIVRLPAEGGTLSGLGSTSALPRFTRFAARVLDFTRRGLKYELERKLGSWTKNQLPSATVSLDNPEITIFGAVLDDRLIVGYFKGTVPPKGWKARRPRSRPFFHPSTLYPKLARALVNLSRIREGETLLDPFCGSGSILIEACLMGVRAIGGDISRRMCAGALNNGLHAGLDMLNVVQADALNVPVVSVDAVATDLPYGRAASTAGRRASELFAKFLAAVQSLLDQGRYCCLMHSSEQIAVPPWGLELVEQHQLRVHRNLTRIVSVFRRR